MNRIVSIVMLAFVVASSASAQSPRTISFQGVLADANGTLVPDGNHQLRLVLYAGATGGSPLYAENQTVPVVKGVFNAIIGSVTPISPSIAFDKAYFLGVSVDNGAELVPRTALTAVPYALHAETADVANAVAPTATGVVTRLNSLSGEITLQGAGSTSVSQNGNVITVASSGGGGGGIQNIQSPDNSIAVTAPTGPTASLSIPPNSIGTVKLADGSVTPAKINTTGAASGQVLSFDGANVGWSTVGGGGSGFSLPYTGSASSVPLPVFHITNSAQGTAIMGDSPTGAGVVGGASSTMAGVWGINTGSGDAVEGTNNATGRAGKFDVTAASNASNAVEVTTIGTGDAVHATSSGRNGVAGFSNSPGDNGVYGANNAGGNGVMGASAGSGSAVYGYSSGTGRAGYFVVGAASDHADAVEATTPGNGSGIRASSAFGYGVEGISAAQGYAGVAGFNDAGGAAVAGRCNSGNGTALFGWTAGTGPAASLQITNASSSSSALTAITAGTGNGVDVSTAGGIGVNAHSGSATLQAIRGVNDKGGGGVIGLAGGAGSGIIGSNTGTGHAGEFEISNSNSSAAVVTITTDGSGMPLQVNAGPSGSNIAVFQKNGANKARIDANGKGYFNGGTQNSGADVAEAFAVEGNRSSYIPGDVLILSPGGHRRVMKSGDPYSTLVAGVVATKPGVLLTERDGDAAQPDLVPMGIVGVIPTRVCCENGPIRVGDLLVTSSLPGCAMRGDRARVEPGMVIGKAMADFNGRDPAVMDVLVNVK